MFEISELRQSDVKDGSKTIMTQKSKSLGRHKIASSFRNVCHSFQKRTGEDVGGPKPGETIVIDRSIVVVGAVERDSSFSGDDVTRCSVAFLSSTLRLLSSFLQDAWCCRRHFEQSNRDKGRRRAPIPLPTLHACRVRPSIKA